MVASLQTILYILIAPPPGEGIRKSLWSDDSIILYQNDINLSNSFTYYNDNNKLINVFAINLRKKNKPTKIKISTPYTNNSLNKPGWNLIFNDEFDEASIDLNKWNKSTPTDDGTANCYDKSGNFEPSLANSNPDNAYLYEWQVGNNSSWVTEIDVQDNGDAYSRLQQSFSYPQVINFKVRASNGCEISNIYVEQITFPQDPSCNK